MINQFYDLFSAVVDQDIVRYREVKKKGTHLVHVKKIMSFVLFISYFKLICGIWNIL